MLMKISQYPTASLDWIYGNPETKKHSTWIISWIKTTNMYNNCHFMRINIESTIESGKQIVVVGIIIIKAIIILRYTVSFMNCNGKIKTNANYFNTYVCISCGHTCFRSLSLGNRRE